MAAHKKKNHRRGVGRPRTSDPLVITSDRRARPDTAKIARAVIDLALREAAREACAQQQASTKTEQQGVECA